MTEGRLAESLADALGSKPILTSNVMAAVEQIMQPSQNELFFCGLPVLVEGLEDVAYLGAHMHLTGQWGEFRRLGGHFVICVGKVNMSRPLAIARGLGIRCFTVFDCDHNERGKNEQQHRRNNSCLLRLAGESTLDPWGPAAVVGSTYAMLGKNIGADVAAEVTNEKWNRLKQDSLAAMGWESGLSPKNGLWIAATIERLYEESGPSQILTDIADAILSLGGDGVDAAKQERLAL